MNPAPPENLLGESLEREAARMRDFAHDPAHYIRIDRGEHVERKYPEALIYRQKQLGWETRIKYTYSVDVLADGRALRHLSMQISVPGEIHQGQLNQVKEHLATQLDGVGHTFFPLDSSVGFNMRALAPIPVVDPTGERNVHFRTPVSFHFTADHGRVDLGALPPQEREYIAHEVELGIARMIHDKAETALPPLVLADHPNDGAHTAQAIAIHLIEAIRAGEWKAYVPARE